MNKIINSNLIYQGRIITVKKLIVELENKQQVIREFVHHQQAVAMIPLINNQIIFVKQFRIGAGESLLEIPAGLIENNEDKENTAIRELQEEIGYKSNKITFMGSYYLSPGYCDELIHLYLCEDLVPSKLKADDDEFITLEYLNICDLPSLIINDTTNPNKKLDAKTYLALSLFLNYQAYSKKGVK